MSILSKTYLSTLKDNELRTLGDSLTSLTRTAELNPIEAPIATNPGRRWFAALEHYQLSPDGPSEYLL